MRDLNSDYEQHLSQVDDPVPGTCTWVLSHETWRRWESLEESALLWITADAGCGKSVIAKSLVNSFISQREAYRRTHICHFFFKEGLDEQDNAAAAVSALLHQLCCSQRRIITHVMSKYISRPMTVFNRFSSLWSILLLIVGDLSTRDIVWILDGLDECEKNSHEELIQAIAKFFDSSINRPARPSFKIILLSRSHNYIQQRLRLGAHDDIENPGAQPEPDRSNIMRLTAEEENIAVAGDIALFVKSKVEELGQNSQLSINLLHRLEQRLINGADLTFLWISLVVQLVQDTATNGISVMELESILNTTELDDVYERLLAGRVQPIKTEKILMIVLAAVRPLSVKEMCVAVEVRQDHRPGLSNDDKALLTEYGPANIDSRRQSILRHAQNPNQAVLAELVKGFRDKQDWSDLMGKDNEGATAKADGILGAFLHPKSAASISSLSALEKALHKPFSNHLRQICGHFVRIRGAHIYLVHQTARQFLLQRTEKHSLPLGQTSPEHPLLQGNGVVTLGNSTHGCTLHTDSQKKWRHSIRLDDANKYLLQVCADYIELFQSETLMDDTLWTGKLVKEYLRECRDDPPRAFLKYAAFHWSDHYRPLRRSQNFSFDYLLKPNDWRFKTWIIVHRGWIVERRNQLDSVGVRIAGTLEDLENTEDDGSAFRPSKQHFETFRHVLDYFNLGTFEETELYDAEFLTGDRYWKDQRDLSSNGEDIEKTNEDDESHNRTEELLGFDECGMGNLGNVIGKLPDRVRYFRKKHRMAYLENLEELCNPLSPNAGNPTSRYSVPADFWT
jgi:protein SERAC1